MGQTILDAIIEAACATAGLASAIFGTILNVAILAAASTALIFLSFDWSEINHKSINSAGDFAQAFIRAVQDQQYLNELFNHFAKDETDASATATVAVAPTAPPATPAGQPIRQSTTPASAAPVSVEKNDWVVTYELDEDDPISNKKIWAARSQHSTQDGGTIFAKATCTPQQSITLEFDSFTDELKGLSYEYQQDNDGHDDHLAIIYRIDDGDRMLILNSLDDIRYSNVSKAIFARVESNHTSSSLDKAEADAKRLVDGKNIFVTALVGGLQMGALALAASEPQDILPFVRAQLVRFQFPLQGGQKEVLPIHPQDPSFQQFLSKCHLSPS
jgi:hypothetical protein